jgi:ATP-binding cassette subfamily B protein
VYLNVWIALAVVVLTPISLLVARTIANNTSAMFSGQSKTRGEQTAFIDEMIDGGRVVQAFWHEEESLADFKEVNERLRKVSFRATFFSSLTNPSTRAVNNVVYAVVALLGGLQLLHPTSLPIFVAFGVGELTACLSYANQYTKPFNEISGVFAELQNAFACATRIGEILTAEPETPDSPTAITLTDAKGDVAIREIAFSYDKSRRLLEDVSVEVSAGQRIAIVGPTGCGKTTLINLLMRFYDVDAGEIVVDGTPIGEITRHSLRTSFGMVLQDSWIRNASVRDNITLGRDFTDEEVIAAAKRAHAHSFIRRLPDGYDTILRGDSSLSQGQKQLISIARVMLLSPPILILDEATSSIDTHTERKIQDAFDTLMEGRTSFIVAHRLSTIRSADCILVMQDGKIVESGKHETLLAKGGLYATIYNSQFEP